MAFDTSQRTSHQFGYGPHGQPPPQNQWPQNQWPQGQWSQSQWTPTPASYPDAAYTAPSIPPPPYSETYDTQQSSGPGLSANEHYQHQHFQSQSPRPEDEKSKQSLDPSQYYGPAPGSVPASTLAPPTQEGQDLAPVKSKDEKFLAKLMSWVPPQPRTPASSMPPLPGPVAIPQIDVSSFDTVLPYLRAYAPILQTHEIEMEDFLAFIDHLTVAQAPTPVSQAMEITGTALGFVPEPISQYTGMGLEFAAGITDIAVSLTRERRFLQRVNRDYLAPRGLKATTCKDKKLHALLQCPADAPRLIPITESGDDPTIPARRLKALEGYVAPFTTYVPPPRKESNWLDRVSAKQVAKKTQKRREAALKDQKKAFEREEKKKKRAIEREEEKRKKREKKREKKRGKKQGKEKSSSRDAWDLLDPEAWDPFSEAFWGDSESDEDKEDDSDEEEEKEEEEELREKEKSGLKHLRWLVVDNLRE